MNPFRKETFWKLASIELVTASGRPDLRRYSPLYRGVLGPVQPSVHVTRQVEHHTPVVLPVNRVARCLHAGNRIGRRRAARAGVSTPRNCPLKVAKSIGIWRS